MAVMVLIAAADLYGRALVDREMTRSPDWQWYGEHPERCYHARLATSAEIAAHDWLDAAQLPPDCFIYALSRIRRDDPPLELQTLLVVLEAAKRHGRSGLHGRVV